MADMSIIKAVKGATKPSNGPPKEKYLRVIRLFLNRDNSSHQIMIVVQLLISRLHSPVLNICLKAHILLHIMISDMSSPRYTLLTYLSRNYCLSPDCPPQTIKAHYCSGQRSSLPKLFPKINALFPQSNDASRFLNAYSGYICMRIRDFSFLNVDPIRERLDRTSIVDSAPTLYLSNSDALLNQAQRVLLQVRKILDGLFTNNLISIPLYLCAYDLLANDLTSLFKFLALALVTALQNFFTLPRADAERTLFMYKEFTGLQIPDEVKNFVNLAANSSDKDSIRLPKPLVRGPSETQELIKALQSYLYREITSSPERYDLITDTPLSPPPSAHSTRDTSLSPSVESPTSFNTRNSMDSYTSGESYETSVVSQVSTAAKNEAPITVNNTSYLSLELDPDSDNWQSLFDSITSCSDPLIAAATPLFTGIMSKRSTASTLTPPNSS